VVQNHDLELPLTAAAGEQTNETAEEPVQQEGGFRPRLAPGLFAASRRPSYHRDLMREPARLVLALAAVGLIALAVPLGLGANAGAGYVPCRGLHPRARTNPSGRWAVSNLRVSRMTCSRAAVAVRAGVFVPTPGGAPFSTPGFRCSFPVGAPLPGVAQRHYACRRAEQRFEFTVPGIR
jgi:hypothetical protein